MSEAMSAAIRAAPNDILAVHSALWRSKMDRIAELEAALHLIRTICASKGDAHHNVAAIDHHAAVALREDK